MQVETPATVRRDHSYTSYRLARSLAETILNLKFMLGHIFSCTYTLWSSVFAPQRLPIANTTNIQTGGTAR